MKLQGRDLSREMHGEDVELLQREPHELAYMISKEETERQFLGHETHKRVLELQTTHWPSVTDEE